MAEAVPVIAPCAENEARRAERIRAWKLVRKGGRFCSVHRIFPYSAPVQLASNLWQVTGSFGVPGVPRNMTVVRTDDGELVLYSVIAMHADGMRALEALGRPAVMVIPHRRHQMDAPFYKQRYPSLRVLAAEPSRVRGVAVDGSPGELSRFGIEAYVVPGNTHEDTVLDAPIQGGRVLCVCETLSNVTPPKGLAGVVLKMFGPRGGSGFGVARAVRLREIRGRDVLRTWLREQAQRSDLRQLLFGHGAAISKEIPAKLRSAADRV